MIILRRDNYEFITVSSFGESLLKQDDLLEEAFIYVISQTESDTRASIPVSNKYIRKRE
jgi:hypothetical protein